MTPLFCLSTEISSSFQARMSALPNLQFHSVAQMKLGRISTEPVEQRRKAYVCNIGASHRPIYSCSKMLCSFVPVSRTGMIVNNLSAFHGRWMRRVNQRVFLKQSYRLPCTDSEHGTLSYLLCTSVYTKYFLTYNVSSHVSKQIRFGVLGPIKEVETVL